MLDVLIENDLGATSLEVGSRSSPRGVRNLRRIVEIKMTLVCPYTTLVSLRHSTPPNDSFARALQAAMKGVDTGQLFRLPGGMLAFVNSYYSKSTRASTVRTTELEIRALERDEDTEEIFKKMYGEPHTVEKINITIAKPKKSPFVKRHGYWK